jgi:hypothetical protein
VRVVSGTASGEGGISMASDIIRSASDVSRVLGTLRRTVTGMLVACLAVCAAIVFWGVAPAAGQMAAHRRLR